MAEQKPPGGILFRHAHHQLSIRLARKSLEEARKALELRRPSIFLGERRYDPFPSENDE
jgi:hypothetical protein